MLFSRMEPKLNLYRLIMVAGVIGFCFSIRENYFPAGWICIVSGIFSIIYLWEELMCSTPSRKTSHYEEIGPLEQFSPVLGYRSNRELDKLILFLIMPFFVWHIMSFGIGYALHQLTAKEEVKQYEVAGLMEKRGRGRAKTSMNIKNMKTYTIFGQYVPRSEYDRIKGRGVVKVDIDSKISPFGTSFVREFEFNNITSK